ncbi:FAD-dependent oxidoreductase [Streptomyces cuspidosporus]|uniref:FAD dependent oxidoreductase domain-containing protein n=1 Tax=Streptomyces cuspidosporus TaxID=66882 RepID=A0ABN3F8X8_9ACTN
MRITVVGAGATGLAGAHRLAKDGCEVTGDTVLLAAGVGTGRMARQLGVPPPIRPGKGYSVDYAPAPVELRTSLTLEDARVAVTPLDGVVRLAGTMEFGGLEEKVNPRRVAAIKCAAIKRAAIKRAATESPRGWGEPGGAAIAHHRVPDLAETLSPRRFARW